MFTKSVHFQNNLNASTDTCLPLRTGPSIPHGLSAHFHLTKSNQSQVPDCPVNKPAIYSRSALHKKVFAIWPNSCLQDTMSGQYLRGTLLLLKFYLTNLKELHSLPKVCNTLDISNAGSITTIAVDEEPWQPAAAGGGAHCWDQRTTGLLPQGHQGCGQVGSRVPYLGYFKVQGFNQCTQELSPIGQQQNHFVQLL